MCKFVSSLFIFFFLNFSVSDFKDVDTRFIRDRFVVIFEINLKDIKVKELFKKYLTK